MGKDVLYSGLCRDVKYLTHASKICQGLEVEGSRYETGVIRVWFAEHYSAHRIRSRQELQRPVSTRSWSMQTVSAATMKLQRPVSTEAVFNLLVCTWQPDCGDGGRDGAKGAQRQHEATAACQHRSCLQPTWLDTAARLRGWRAGWRKGRLKAAWSKCRDPWSPNNNHQQALKNDLHFRGLLRGMLRGYASGCASGVCFARAPPSTNTYLGPREKNINPYVECIDL